ncbi:hypothetical protein ACVWYG_002557 [Pedobacter sp. UYEF25]
MKTLTKITRVEEIRKIDLTQKQAVCELLQWTEQMYFDFMFAQYEEFLNRMFSGYPIQFLNDVKYSPVFSGFWNNEIAARNEFDFLPFANTETEDYYEVDVNGELQVLQALPVGDIYLIDEFMFIHNPQRLMHDDAFMHRYNKTLRLLDRKYGKLK